MSVRDYDQGCYDLAWTFLEDAMRGTRIFHERDAEALALQIQALIEDYITDGPLPRGPFVGRTSA